jgi:hypothetical protein
MGAERGWIFQIRSDYRCWDARDHDLVGFCGRR